jgi:hypothetical protein
MCCLSFDNCLHDLYYVSCWCHVEQCVIGNKPAQSVIQNLSNTAEIAGDLFEVSRLRREVRKALLYIVHTNKVMIDADL